MTNDIFETTSTDIEDFVDEQNVEQNTTVDENVDKTTNQDKQQADNSEEQTI